MAEQKLPDKAQENEMKREKVRVVPIKYIDDSPDHPFQVRDDEEMMSLVESIATFGVITPVIARKTADERYELISGHRRKRACELLHIDSLPIIVRDLSREEGIILMVDSNLQREHILCLVVMRCFFMPLCASYDAMSSSPIERAERIFYVLLGVIHS